jgi:hypothetical protein
MLNRLRPSTAGATIGLSPTRAVYEPFQREVPSETEDSIYNAHEKYIRYGAVCPGHASPVLMLRATLVPKTCSLVTFFTTGRGVGAAFARILVEDATN